MQDHPPIMKMGIKVLECKLTSVNKYVEVEHLRGSIDQGTSKDKKWSKGSKESAKGQGKTIQV